MVEPAYKGPDCDLPPDPAMMAAFCRWWFANADNGVLEIGWMNPVTGDLTEFQQFERDDIPTLAATATQINMVAGQSVYIRAATVRAHPFPPYTGDKDFVQATGIWSDIDTADDLKRAQTVQTMVRPNAQVITGTVPTLRVQSWFRTEMPIVSRELVRDLNVRLHRLYGGDSAVINPSRLMRLPGTIAWPWKDLEIRVPELVRLIMPEPGSGRTAAYPLAALTTQLPREDTGQINGTPHEPFDFGIRGLSTVAAMIAAIKSGNPVWHNTMIRLVAHWVGQGRTTVEIMGHCADWTLPGYTIADTRREVAKAIQTARDKWGVQDQEAHVGAAPENPFGTAVYDPWGELMAPEFPIHALPGVIRAFVENRARIMGADPCAIAWSALSACSAALDGRTRLRMKRVDTWMVPPPLWVALVGEPSTKKTPIFTETWRPLEELQTISIRAYTDQVSEYNRLPKEERKDTEPPPRPRRIISHDATIEGIQDILANQDRGLAMFHDELAGFIGGMDKYSNGKGGSDRAFYLRSYTGGPHVVDRVGRGIVSSNNMLLTICGGIQPDRLASFKDLMDDGLWQRFLPIITVQPEELGTDESDIETNRDYALRLQGLVDVSNGHIASLSNDAHAIRAEVEQELFRLERLKPLGVKFSSFMGKLPGVFGRLCLVLSYLEPRGLGYVVSRQTAEAARTLLMKCVLPHAVHVYLNIGETSAPLETIRAIAGFILGREPSRLLISDLTTGVRACRGKSVPDIAKLLSPLVAGGWLLPESELPNNRAWKVNPNVRTIFAERAMTEKQRRKVAREILTGTDDEAGC